MGPYHLEFFRPQYPGELVRCTNTRTKLVTKNWGTRYAGGEFHERECAIEVAETAQKFWASCKPWRVVDSRGTIVWQSDINIEQEESTTMNTDIKPDISEPLNLKRIDVIKRLNELFEKEKTDREAAAAKEKDDRQKVLDFIAANPERVAEFIRSHSSGSSAIAWSDASKHILDEEFSADNWTPRESKPAEKENELEKFVRVLAMSSDETVALTPNKPLYNLL